MKKLEPQHHSFANWKPRAGVTAENRPTSTNRNCVPLWKEAFTATDRRCVARTKANQHC